ncbi:MAG: class II aldolase/adducin family protein, partial [Sulfolobales archaeon]|nr:class II aldolase/adducin family protein [Sulfolobales archaeon]
RICYVGELTPGSRELAEAVGRAVSSGCKVVVLKNHGIVGVGRSLGEALEAVEAVENSFKKSLVLYVLDKLKAFSTQTISR